MDDNLSMGKSKPDLMVKAIEQALRPGSFISYGQSWDFIHGLEELKIGLNSLIEEGESERAVKIYERLLDGCSEKAEEIDDSSGTLGMFFSEAFCSWIKARQKAGYNADDTVRTILNWIEHFSTLLPQMVTS